VVVVPWIRWLAMKSSALQPIQDHDRNVVRSRHRCNSSSSAASVSSSSEKTVKASNRDVTSTKVSLHTTGENCVESPLVCFIRGDQFQISNILVLIASMADGSVRSSRWFLHSWYTVVSAFTILINSDRYTCYTPSQKKMQVGSILSGKE
jgi:hypothetical protein